MAGWGKEIRGSGCYFMGSRYSRSIVAQKCKPVELNVAGVGDRQGRGKQVRWDSLVM